MLFKAIGSVAIVVTSFAATLIFMSQSDPFPLVRLPVWLGGVEIIVTGKQDIKLAAPRGKLTLVNHFAPHLMDCTADPGVQFIVLSKALNGKTTMRNEIVALQAGPFQNCVGTKVGAVAVYYMPEAGFVGEDSVTIRQSQGQRAFDYRFVINVD